MAEQDRREDDLKSLRRIVSILIVATLAISAVFVVFQPAMAQSASTASSSASSTAATCDLIVHVDKLRNMRGKVGTIVFNSAAGWPEDQTKSLRHGPSDIVMTPTGPASTVVWKNLPPGDYAIAAIHDENENHKLDRNFFHIPTEGFGFANNPHVGLSAPSFSAATVHLTCPSTQTTIHIQYR